MIFSVSSVLYELIALRIIVLRCYFISQVSPMSIMILDRIKRIYEAAAAEHQNARMTEDCADGAFELVHDELSSNHVQSLISNKPKSTNCLVQAASMEG